MENFYDTACEIYNIWHSSIKKNVSKELSFLFENELSSLKEYSRAKDYKKTVPIIQSIINGFNPDNYKDKPWQNSAESVLEKLNLLEKIAKENSLDK
ncbi:MAG: hypothetical protein ACP5OG_01075 [Candidatus Nanoarchaeia archaeon]